MKKILLLLLLLIPFDIKALLKIDCQDKYQINIQFNCSLIYENNKLDKIDWINVPKIENISNVKSNYKLNFNNGYYQINVASEEEKIEVLSFDYNLNKSNDILTFNDIIISSFQKNQIESVTKTFKIMNAAKVKKILINNQPVTNFSQDLYTYNIDLYKRNDYIELKIITDDNNKVEESVKLLKTSKTPSYSFQVDNGINQATYILNFNYGKASDNKNNISIKEIPFNFNPQKKYYYLEVANELKEITIENSSQIYSYILNNGENEIRIDDYLFVINRLSELKVNKNAVLTQLKLNGNFLNLKEGVYNYSANKDHFGLVELVSASKDYEVNYNEEKITINIYDNEAYSQTITINFLTEDNLNIPIKAYNKTPLIILFSIFLILVILISYIIVNKYKKNLLKKLKKLVKF